MNSPQRRLPAEWEPVQAVILAWPHAQTDWADMLDEVWRCYADMIAAIAPRATVILIGPEEPDVKYLPSGADRDNVIFIQIPTNDTWTRDYGPITTLDAEGRCWLNDFKFNGWGLKFAADQDNLTTLRLCRTGIFDAERINRLGFVLEGGSIESDGQGTLITTEDCLLSPNRNGDLSRDDIENYLKDAFGLKRVLWLSKGALEGDDTDGHIDTLVRLAPPGDIIFYTGCSDPADSHYSSLKAMEEELKQLRTADGKPYHLIELPLPSPVYDPEDGSRLPATYANFLILNDAVLLPVYGQKMNDLHAKLAIQAAMPEYDIIPINCCALIRQHGSLHCSTMQLPADSLAI